MEYLSNRRFYHCERLVQECAHLKPLETEKKVKEFVLQLWPTLELEPECGSVKGIFWLSADKKAEKPMWFLTHKLRSILVNHVSQSREWKVEICFNVISNFNTALSSTLKHIKLDIQYDEEIQQIFGIDKYAKMDFVVPLGDETHNRGQIPWLVVFEDGKKLVYKPRSLIAEELICGAKDGFFKHFHGLEVYKIHNKQTYGYCEFLENNKDPMTAAELGEYVANLWDMELICRALRMSDIHSGNLIASKKKPFIIDMEVVLLPASKMYSLIGTCIYEGNTAGFRFNDETKNIILVGNKDELKSMDVLEMAVDSYPPMEYHKMALKILGKLEELKEEKNELRSLKKQIEGLNKESLQNSKLSKQERFPFKQLKSEMISLLSDAERDQIRLKNFLKDAEQIPYHTWTTTQEAEVKKIRLQLRNHRHRIVLVDTKTLGTIIITELGQAKNRFIQVVEENLKVWGFQSHVTIGLAGVLQAFEEDFRNNDVPIFYHDPKTHEIFYNGNKIGSK